MGVSKCAFVSIAAWSAPTIQFWSAGSIMSSNSCIAAVRMTGERWITRPYPHGSKVLGKAPAGHRCYCGSGRYVYLIQLPREKEAAERHKHCAIRYWRKMQEVPPDSGARHSSRHDYNFHIASAEWQRFKCEVIKQRGNRCERCGQVSASLELHHLHYHSLGSEQPEDVELLCPKCHKGADEARAAKSAGGRR